VLADVTVGAWEAQRRRPGDLVDLRDHADEIVWAATRAPSYRNTQPWLIRVAARQVEVYADRSRSCPVADPEGRELFLGLGAAVFGVRLALTRLRVRRSALPATTVPTGCARGRRCITLCWRHRLPASPGRSSAR
jgi:hypothetical protein